MPDPIRETLIDQIATTLKGITKAAGYTRTIANVHKTPPNTTNTPTPAIVVTQGNESVGEFVGPIYERNLFLNLTFVDSYGGNDADGEALEFLSDIQKMMGTILGIQFNAPRYGGGTGTAQAAIVEQSSALNYSEPMRGKIYGTVSYMLTYRTSSRDPYKLP